MTPVESLDLSVYPIFSRMTQRGLRVDIPKMQKLAADVSTELDMQEALVSAFAGRPLNPHSSKDVGKWIQDAGESGDIPWFHKRTKKGAVATDEKTLVHLTDLHPLPGAVLECRGLKKLLSTFIEPVLLKTAKTDSTIHPRWRLTRVRSGRPSMEDPNLLAFPSRDAWGKKVRGCFVARPGHVLIGCDFSQIEPRLTAALSADPGLVEVYARGLDLYEDAARRIFRIGPEKEVDRAAQRTPAKVTTLGIMYGLGDSGLYDQLILAGCGTPNNPNFDVEACGGLRQAWFEAYPGVTELVKATVARAKAMMGEVRTVMGRPRFLPALLLDGRRYPASKLRSEAERQGFNHLIQGTAAEEMKKAMVRVDAMGLPAYPLLQIYDEMVYEVPEGDAEVLAEIVEARMTTEFVGAKRVTLQASAKIGGTWEELK